MIKAIHFDPSTGDTTRVTLPTNSRDRLNMLHKLCNCDTIDFSHLGMHDIGFYCDDEGLLKDDTKPSIIWMDKDDNIKHMIMGPVVFVHAHADDKGDCVGLNNIQDHYIHFMTVAEIRHKRFDAPMYALVPTPSEFFDGSSRVNLSHGGA